MRKFKLKLDHPYAKAGTIVEEFARRDDVFVEVKIRYKGLIIYAPIPCEEVNSWLEEVKEEPTCSKEFAEDLKEFLFGGSVVFLADHQEAQINEWLDAHTSKDDQS